MKTTYLGASWLFRARVDTLRNWKQVLVLSIFIFGVGFVTSCYAVLTLTVGTGNEDFIDLHTAVGSLHNYGGQETEAVIVLSDGTHHSVGTQHLNFSTIGNITKLTIESANGPENCTLIGNPQYNESTDGRVFDIVGHPYKSLAIRNITMRHTDNSNRVFNLRGMMRDLVFEGCIFIFKTQAINVRCESVVSTPRNITINNCTFTQLGIVEGYSYVGCIAIHTYLRTSITISDNLFQEVKKPMLINCYEHSTIICDNLFLSTVWVSGDDLNLIQVDDLSSSLDSSLLFCCNTLVNTGLSICRVNSIIENNTFRFTYNSTSSMGIISASNWINAGDPTDVITAEVRNNVIVGRDQHCAITATRFYTLGIVDMSIENNSIIGTKHSLKVEYLGSSNENRISVFRNNLIDCTDDPMTVLLRTGNMPRTQVPISHCMFVNGYPTNTAVFAVDEMSCPIGNPGIVPDQQNNTYSLIWDEDTRSPLIMSGYSSPDNEAAFMDRPDIGAVQYDAQPHEYSTYTFPAGNDRNGIKWMSFPSLDRIYGIEDLAWHFLGDIINQDKLISIKWKELNYNYEELINVNGTWYGQNHRIQPQIGYKFQMNPNLAAPVTISTPAIKPDPTLPIILKARTNQRTDIPDNENWLGYYGEATVHPYDAFEGVLNNLWYIQHQDWTLVRLSVVPGSPWIGVAYPGFRQPSIKYGDMVIVKCFNDAQFTWNTEAPVGESFIKEYPTKFSFTEKLDYIPVYVEFTGSEIPKEAAVYVEGICKGAAVVGGNSVEIPAYILDDIGYNAELELRVYYDNKSAYNSIPQYQVWNMEGGQYENNSLILSERKPYYMLKMDSGSVNNTPAPKLYLGSYPNPFNPDTSLRFTLPDDADISLDIFNVKGQKVRSLKSGSHTAGTHTCLWDAKDNGGNRVASGLYFAMLSYQGKQLSRKLLLMK